MVREITISYNQISQVITNTGIIFATVEIITTGEDHIVIKYISKKIAKAAKNIIDQKIYHAHAKHQPNLTMANSATSSYEKGLARLKELLIKEKITEQEYETKRAELLEELL